MILASTVNALPSQAQAVENVQQTGDTPSTVTASASSDPQESVSSEEVTLDATPPEVEAVDASPQVTRSSLPSEAVSEPASLQLLNGSTSIFQVSAHPLDQQSAATLYVRNIPVLTFVGPEEQASPPDGTEAALVEPVSRANAMGSQIEQIQQADTISVRWDTDREQYVVMVAEGELVALGDDITLPDSTDNLAEDALQVANRLRRLLGGADPISEIEGRPEPPAPTVAVSSSYTGMASWYGPGFHGRRSASGEVFNQNAYTAAHRTLPFGTQVRVTNLNNGRQVTVRINDRGPFSGHRVIDLSAGAARSIGLTSAGVGPVRLEVIGR